MSENKIANPAPLGLLGFGMTTVLLNFHNAGLTDLNIAIIAMGFALGGAAQIVAGIMEFKKNNVFGATAFTAYGFFWWSLIIVWWNPLAGISSTAVVDVDGFSKGLYLFLWGLFTLFMFIGSLTHNRATQVVFCSLTLLFFLLAAGQFAGSELIINIAGYVGIFCGSSAIYASFAQILNNEYGKTVLPLGEKKD
ncbi:MAG: acetate uptake transporter [Coriobacteriia bacterium]|nr:acetate uptake transporter [Coriobacteriia bacterium]MCL2750405.1 acetate uptake transporter [Coriobacteriia bacterium]